VSSIKQIAANRRNAQRSTGPTTDAGKAKASRNALKHGILSRWVLVPGESEEKLNELSAALRADRQPGGPLEDLLVDDAVALIWRLRRLSRVEAGIFANYRYEQKLETALDPVKEYLEDDEKKLVSTPFMKEKFDKEVEQQKQAALDVKQLTPTLGRAFVREEEGFGKLSRYEQQIRRELHRTLHELERVQARRRGDNVAPPAAVDLTLNAGLLA